ncbi:LuxR C-terminal-related transcriptional regulator [Paraburkholderia silviterrae]|uniref:LuxR C-terminal-related transcriptional regulator n=1 Tax=Paraburkholderia silviterrae TaxID=2528715 RepID=UPI001F10F3D0|nr:LuxR C-terminal-related transcriptional regulator [Paraburkholderia silviterrae]
MTQAVPEAMPVTRPPLLLATKVVPPRLPAGLIERPRFNAYHQRLETQRVAIIRAPAGFGKTSLALSWLDALRAHGARVAWLSLDADDDEPAHYFHHLAHALQRACGTVGASAIGLTAEATFVPANSLAAALINELAEVDDELYLFIDDYHLIGDATIHEAMSRFVLNVPSNVHVVICTRVDPPLPLAKLRAGNELCEIDASALRFNFDETRRFVERACPGKLRSGELKSLHATTEGWAAALRLSASALAREEHPHGWMTGAPGSVPTGASKPVSDYLEDILAHLPPAMHAFMLRTAILERLSAPLCEALTGVTRSQDMLESIVARQLLLEPLDQEGRWFRYHRLMAEYLQRRLQDRHRDELAHLHDRAWHWYAREEQWTDAVRHAIAAGATGEAIRLMERCAQSLLKRGDLLTLVGWQRQFPSDLMRAQVSVTLATAWGTALSMRFDEAAQMLDSIERDAQAREIDANRDANPSANADANPDANPDASPDAEAIRWSCLAIRSALAALQDNPGLALELARRFLNGPSTDVWTRNAVSNVARFCHWKSGDLEALYATPWIPDSLEEDQRSVFSSVYRLCLLGHAELQQLHVPIAARRFDEAMQLAERHAGPHSVSAALCAPMIAQIHYEHGRLDEAEALLVELMPVIERAVLLDSVLIAYRILVRIAQVRQNYAGAHLLLDQAQALGQARGWSRLLAAALVERTRLYLAENRITEATVCVAELGQLARPAKSSASPVSPEIENFRDLAVALLALKRQQLSEAADASHAALARCERLHGTWLAARLRTVLAMTWLAAGKQERALGAFEQVAQLCAPAGLYQSILDHGVEIGPLLKLARERFRDTPRTRETAAWLERLLDGWRAIYEPGSQLQREGEGEREPLSARERKIVELIAQGQSNKEIARTLGVTPETVKSHLKNIFVKLAVDKRAQAVSRAQALGLIGRH